MELVQIAGERLNEEPRVPDEGEEHDEDSGYESETAKADSEDEDTSSCYEVKVVAADRTEECEHQAVVTEGGMDIALALASTTDEADPEIPWLADVREVPVKPLMDVNDSFNSDDESDDEFFDSPEDPDVFDAFAVT